ncbi:hypothetical protein [Stenotrophomonas maltophilia]|uniref:hypothetical protein n=1 Tax=Stenotrophomonas maltophilia TaxID=40324 RepID=UPI0013DB674A|nr:hypothetical protein [Stenotrophomonas maltophilia]
MSGLQQWWHGISPCMELGVGDCVVWWDAWAVVVGLMVGVATVAVAVLAWRTSERARKIASEASNISARSTEISERSAKIAEAAKNIAQQQHQEGVQLREGIARIIGGILQYEIAHFPARIGNVIRVLNRGTFSDEGIVIGVEDLDWVLRQFRSSPLPATEQAQDRLHNLPEKLGFSVAELVGNWKALSVPVLAIDERIVRDQSESELVIMKKHPDFESLGQLRQSLRHLLAISIGTAKSFAKFVGHPPEDYSEEEVLLRSES